MIFDDPAGAFAVAFAWAFARAAELLRSYCGTCYEMGSGVGEITSPTL